MKSLLTILLLSLGFSLSAQKTIPYLPLNSYNPHDTNFSDFKQLDTIFKSKRLIGLGEATHGTSEFTKMRHRLFRYLVENHGYNTFFLEADFGACQRVNRYIHGEIDTVKSAVNEIVLWPWVTEEMVEMVEWMRVHNLRNPEHQIQFVGCDMQLMAGNLMELERFLIRIQHPGVYQMNSFMNYEQMRSDSALQQELLVFMTTIPKEFDHLDITETDRNEFFMLQQTFKQRIIYNTNVGPITNARDSCMAKNILTYMNLFPNTKGIYFAHNLHTCTAHYNYNDPYQDTWTGYYLRQSLGNSYFVIGQELDHGSVYALTWEGSKKIFKTFELETSDKKALGYFLNRLGPDHLFCMAKYIPRLKKMKMTGIGAAYGVNSKGDKYSRYYYETRFYDAFIFIRNTTASHVYSIGK